MYTFIHILYICIYFIQYSYKLSCTEMATKEIITAVYEILYNICGTQDVRLLSVYIDICMCIRVS